MGLPFPTTELGQDEWRDQQMRENIKKYGKNNIENSVIDMQQSLIKVENRLNSKLSERIFKTILTSAISW